MKVLYLGKTISNKIYNDTIYDAIVKDRKYFLIKDDTGNKNTYEKSLFKEIHILFKVKFLGRSNSLGCINGNIYNITSDLDDLFYEVIDETKQTYMYLKNDFEIIPNNINILEINFEYKEDREYFQNLLFDYDEIIENYYYLFNLRDPIIKRKEFNKNYNKNISILL